MLLPSVSNLALKEWAVAVKALSEGKQILILRKGGIHRDDKDFRVIHHEFLLYPTYEHQLPKLLKEDYHRDIQQTLEDTPPSGMVTLAYLCRVTHKFELTDQEVLDRISPHHIWTTDYAQKRLRWKPNHPLTIALLRLYRLQQPHSLPVLEEYAGCKSWVDLGQDVPLGMATPVLSDEVYEDKAKTIHTTLNTVPSAIRPTTHQPTTGQ